MASITSPEANLGTAVAESTLPESAAVAAAVPESASVSTAVDLAVAAAVTLAVAAVAVADVVVDRHVNHVEDVLLTVPSAVSVSAAATALTLTSGHAVSRTETGYHGDRATNLGECGEQETAMD